MSFSADHLFAYLRDTQGIPEAEIKQLAPNALAARIQGIHKGLSAEHEFAAVASWLGKCSLVSQLDDVLHTSGVYRAPDFLVVANYRGREVPFLVEVKSVDRDTLEWSAKYLDSLRAFAELTHLPLLTAWKRGRLWVLADSNLFTKRVTAYHLSFEDALKNSLMSTLFDNAWIEFSEEFRLELTMRIQGSIDFEADLLPEGMYTFQIEDAAIWGSKGRISADQHGNLWWLLVTAISDSSFERVKDVGIQRFTAKSDMMFNLSDVLLTQLLWGKDQGQNLDWLNKIRKGLPKPEIDLRAALRQALNAGGVRYIFDQVPQTLPEFLK